MDFFNIIYNGYTIQSNFKFLTEFFVREFESANVKGYSFESFKEGIEVELSNMRYESRKPFFAEISELNSKHITFFLSNDLEQMKNIENEIQKLCYENCSLDLYKYSNPEFMGIVPDEDLENGFRMKTKKEFKKLQKAIGVKVLPYEGVIYYADIDIIENHLNDAYNQIINESQQTVNEPQLITKETINPYPDLFKGFDNTNFLIFETYSKKYIIDWYLDYSFLFQKMISKTENRLHEVKHIDFMNWLKDHNYISEKVHEDFIKKGTFSTKCSKVGRENNYYHVINDLFK